jgi:hypothetical protein
MPSKLQQLDAFMAESPWHPRVVPFFVFILGLFLIGFATRASPLLYPVLFGVVVAIIGFLLWRYRRLTPELNLRWHWSVLPSAVFLTVAWLVLGYGWNVLWAGDFKTVSLGEHDTFGPLAAAGLVWFWVAFSLRFVGMVVMVPLFEEMFIRSAMLRALHDWKTTKVGLMQVGSDLPMLGEAIAHKPAVVDANAQPPAFTRNLVNTPLGAVTLFSTIASTVVFTASHLPRDWAGCLVCGVVWCAMVGWTNRASLPADRRLGLGPVVWSHALVNAALWFYSYFVGDWQFL